MVRLPTIALTATLTLLTATPALADDSFAPQFATLDRQSRDTSLTVDMNFTTDTQQVNARFARFDLHGQWIGSQGYGAYATLPFTQALIDGSFEDMALGNIEIGHVYNRRLRADIDLNLRAGMVLPSADADVEGRAANASGSFGRITDLATASPDTTWVRVSASPIVRNDRVFVRADLGLDIAVDAPEAAEPPLLVRANLGAGVDAGPVAITGEVASIGDVQTDAPFLHTAAISARFETSRNVSPSISFSTPLDKANRGDAWTLGFGLQSRF